MRFSGSVTLAETRHVSTDFASEPWHFGQIGGSIRHKGIPADTLSRLIPHPSHIRPYLPQHPAPLPPLIPEDELSPGPPRAPGLSEPDPVPPLFSVNLDPGVLGVSLSGR